jgi:8-oxo-dGTP pyrophosphatase MutT (NUDIX family)
VSEPFSIRTRRAVDDELVRLRDAYGEFPVLTVTRLNEPEFFEHGIEYFEEGHRGAAGARIVEDAPADEREIGASDGRILLTREARDPETWILPGGGHEPGESFEETAEREVWEEAGVEIRVTGVWRAVRKRFVHREQPARRGYLLELFFTAEPVGGTPGVHPERWDEGSEEVLEARWFDAVPEDASEVVTEPLATLELGSA